MIKLPDSIAPLAKIGLDDCLCGAPGCQGHPPAGGEAECFCGLPGCLGHPVVISGGREKIEFTRDEYDFLLGDLHRRMD